MVKKESKIAVVHNTNGNIYLPSTEIPSLYRYMSPPDAEQSKFSETNLETLIVKNKIRLTGPTEVNDPNDCNPHYINDLKIDHFKKYLSSIINDLKQKESITAEEQTLLNKYPSRQVIRKIRKIPDDFEKGMETATMNVFSKLGFTCLSANGESELMWSHYADSHTGVCIEFRTLPINTTSNKNSSEELPFTASCVPADYKNERAQFIASDNLLKINQNQMRQALLRKSTVWEYEKEWRFYADIARQSGILRSEDLVDLGPNAIKSITLGVKSTPITKAKISNMIKKINYTIEFFKASFDTTTFKMRRERIKYN